MHCLYRLKALQKNGEEGWKQRISKYEDSPQSGLKERLNSLNHNSKFEKNNEVIMIQVPCIASGVSDIYLFVGLFSQENFVLE